MGGGSEYCGGVLPLCRLPHIVIGAVLKEVVEGLYIFWIPEVSAPCMADRELVEAQHVCHWHLHVLPRPSAT